MSPQIRLAVWVAAIVTPSWFLITFIDPDFTGPWEEVGIGHFIGTMFAHATLAAAWCALGPGLLIWRIPFSIVWVAVVVAGVGINMGINGGPPDAIVAFGVIVFGQYFVSQVPFWLVVLGFGLGLRHNSETSKDAAKQLQFGIFHLLIITAIAATLLGVGRLTLAVLPSRGEYPIFIFLVVAATIQSVPLLLAALMRRYAIPAALAILALIAIATVWELSILRALKIGNGPNIWHFIFINAFTVALTLLVAVTVRLNGFSLSMRVRNETA